VQVDRRIDDALARFGLLLRAFLEGVSAGHANLPDVFSYLDTQSRIVKLRRHKDEGPFLIL
jgi:hypothetical protein